MKKILYFFVPLLVVIVIVLGLICLVSAVLVGLGMVIAHLLSTEPWLGTLLAIASTLVTVFSSWVVYRAAVSPKKDKGTPAPSRFVPTGRPTETVH